MIRPLSFIICALVLSMSQGDNRIMKKVYERKITSEAENGSFTFASRSCAERLSSLAFINSEEEQRLLRAEGVWLGLTTIWLNIRFKLYRTWKCQGEGRCVRGAIRLKEDANCAAIKLGVSKPEIYARDCFLKLDGYICEWQDCSKCPFGSGCRQLDEKRNHCTRVIEVEKSWYKASIQCAKHQGELFSGNGIEIIAKETTSKFLALAWIGASHGGWYSYTNQSVDKKIKWSNWKEGTKTKLNHDCAVMKLHDGIWEPALCNESHQFICLPGHLVSSTIDATTKKPTLAHMTLVIILSTGLAAAVVLVIILILFLCFCHRRTWRAPSTRVDKLVEMSSKRQIQKGFNTFPNITTGCTATTDFSGYLEPRSLCASMARISLGSGYHPELNEISPWPGEVYPVLEEDEQYSEIGGPAHNAEASCHQDDVIETVGFEKFDDRGYVMF